MRRAIEVVALALLLAAVTLAAIIVGRGTKTVQIAQSPAAKVASTVKATPTLKAQVSLPCPPPPGEGVPGACVAKPVQVYGAKTGVTVTPATNDPPVSIPDVSSWQGVVNWSAVKTWQVQHHFTPAGIFKMGEYVLDPYASHNNAQLTALHMWRMGYWFLRRTGCVHEATQIVGEARTLRLSLVAEDDEAPEAAGYDGCITADIHHLDPSLIVTEYSSPGAYPGGTRSSNPAWIAAYGPLNPPAAPWGGPIKAFQCTDGVFGCVTSVPGLGRGDMSVDYGLTKLGSAVTPPKPRLICFGPKAQTKNATCKSVRAKVAKWQGASTATHKSLLRARKSLTDYQKLTSVLNQRARWFDSRILTTTKQYS